MFSRPACLEEHAVGHPVARLYLDFELVSAVSLMRSVAHELMSMIRTSGDDDGLPDAALPQPVPVFQPALPGRLPVRLYNILAKMVRASWPWPCNLIDAQAYRTRIVAQVHPSLLQTKAWHAPPNAPFQCVDMFAGRAAVAKAFRAKGHNAVALDIAALRTRLV